MCDRILMHFYRYIDDGITPWPSDLDFDDFMSCLNSLNPCIKYTSEAASIDEINNLQSLNFLDISIILHASGTIETDIYYKKTSSHDYLPLAIQYIL